MDFEITPQREAYLNARGQVMLNACPGSGKTTCIIHKLALLEKECALNHGKYVGIACLSFTNVAKNEIFEKYRQAYGVDFRFPHLVSTIDSFINQFITLPYYNLLNKDFTRPRIIDQAGIIDKLLSTRYQDRKTGKWMTGMISPINAFKDKSNRALFRVYPPSKIWIDITGKFTFQGKAPDTTVVDAKTFFDYGKAIFEWKGKKGVITSLDSAFMALHLLKANPRIGEWLVNRFPYIIIDEAQDTSEIQHAIFDKLLELGLSNIEMVGDPYQSLYEWRDAKPQLFVQKYGHVDWTGLPLSQNRRSVQRVIDCFSIVRSKVDEVITTWRVVDLGIPILIYKYTDINHPLIIADFEKRCADQKFINNHIVVRGNALKNQMLGNIAEIDPWKFPHPAEFLRIRHQFESNEIKNAVNGLRKMMVELLNPGVDYIELKTMESDLESDYKFNGKLYHFLFSIPTTGVSFQVWSDQCVLEINNCFGIDVQGFFEFKMKINGYKMADLKKQNVDLYFKKSASNNNIPITTIHQIKGATLDGILYFFDERSSGEGVSFNDFKETIGFPVEKQRIIYVACSRPRQLLAMAFPVTITDEQLIEKFGAGIEIVLL